MFKNIGSFVVKFKGTIEIIPKNIVNNIKNTPKNKKHKYGYKEVIECKSKTDLKIVDLTGAGDLFAAGFLHGFINNISTKEALEKGTDMSAKIIQKVGARLN